MKSIDVIQPSVLNQPIANVGSRNIIPQVATVDGMASIEAGFPDTTMLPTNEGGLPPRGQDCNGLFYISTDQKVFLQNGGVITFSQAVSDSIGGYPKGAILDYVTETGFTKVRSLIEDNTNNFVSDPSLIDGTNWAYLDFGGANQSLSNLTPIGETHFLNKTQITNCILESPHMVDLELNDGTLTLKAGSKVIVPYGISAPTKKIGDTLNGGTIVDISWDGSKLFYIVQITNNAAHKETSNGKRAALINSKGVLAVFINQISSDTQPELTGNNLWYDTVNNIAKRIFNNSVVESYLSFPFAFATSDTTGFININQIFQSIGYIGSHVWVNKGLKALQPNGRNEDGTLNNIERITQNVITYTRNTTGVDTKLWLRAGNSLFYSNGYYYYPEENFIRNANNDIAPMIEIGVYDSDGGVVSNLRAKNTFCAVDSNDIDVKGLQTAYIIETYVNGASGYNLYSNGYCEQWGTHAFSSTGWENVNLLKEYNSTNYSVSATNTGNTNTNYNVKVGDIITNTTSILKLTANNAETSARWVTRGYVN